jgi:hypothetical protein
MFQLSQASLCQLLTSDVGQRLPWHQCEQVGLYPIKLYSKTRWQTELTHGLEFAKP